MIPSVSVVIPTYNYGRFIAETIESVLAQTLPPAEIIVVDDGSTDETEEIVRGFGDKVRYIRQENQGVCEARNNGVANSSGEYIAFLDADDIWEPEKLEKQIAKFTDDDEIGLVHCGMREFDDGTGETIRLHLEGREGWVADDILLWKGPVIVGPGGTIVVTRMAFNYADGFDPKLKVGEDLDFCYRVAKKYKVGFVAEVLVEYRSHGANAHSNVREMELGMSRFYEKAFETGGDSVRKLRREAYGSYFRVLAGSYYHAGSYGRFAVNAIKVLWYAPRSLEGLVEVPFRWLNQRFRG